MTIHNVAVAEKVGDSCCCSTWRDLKFPKPSVYFILVLAEELATEVVREKIAEFDASVYECIGKPRCS
jgi:hypothetical protein